ncbi:hypothetical protein NDU88_009227 [Pleurodeles waltl]|uniref:Uncharacterized protein n=1 Tax=Pleurodeles waltl TaxID=8319 RepID=A0AAV7QUP8_PLEWA|nr:hypothetical protein NDU88_009227 [Pleurodeles waltl]
MGLRMSFRQYQQTGRRASGAPAFRRRQPRNLDRGRRFSAPDDFRGSWGAARGVTSSLRMTAQSPRTFEAPPQEVPPYSAVEPQTGRERARQTRCEAPKRLAERNAKVISRAPKTEAVFRRLLGRRLRRTVSGLQDAVYGS